MLSPLWLRSHFPHSYHRQARERTKLLKFPHLPYQWSGILADVYNGVFQFERYEAEASYQWASLSISKRGLECRYLLDISLSSAMLYSFLTTHV